MSFDSRGSRSLRADTFGDPPKRERIVYIYVVYDHTTQHVKIGTSVNPRSRLISIQTGNPNRVELVGYVVGSVEEEKAIHRRLLPYKAHKGKTEWFVLNDVVSDEVNALLSREGAVLFS